jgi:dipeptidyl aminopeptidase/acylaminoacyl peptidase
VSFFGPTDMTDMYNNPTNALVPPAIVQVVGKTPTQDPVIYANSSPVNYVTSLSPPTILLHGGADPLVRWQQSLTMKNLLQTAGVVNQYVFYPGEGHGWVGANLYDSFNKIQAFIIANVN